MLLYSTKNTLRGSHQWPFSPLPLTQKIIINLLRFTWTPSGS